MNQYIKLSLLLSAIACFINVNALTVHGTVESNIASTAPEVSKSDGSTYQGSIYYILPDTLPLPGEALSVDEINALGKFIAPSIPNILYFKMVSFTEHSYFVIPESSASFNGIRCFGDTTSGEYTTNKYKDPNNTNLLINVAYYVISNNAYSTFTCDIEKEMHIRFCTNIGVSADGNEDKISMKIRINNEVVEELLTNNPEGFELDEEIDTSYAGVIPSDCVLTPLDAGSTFTVDTSTDDSFVHNSTANGMVYFEILDLQ